MHVQVLAQRSLLKRLFAYDMALPEERLRRAVSYGGSAERIHRVLHKLIRGDAITVAAVGGSVTGALKRIYCTGHQQQLHESRMCLLMQTLSK